MGNVINDGPGHIEFRLNDGGRLTRVSYNEYDLLASEPKDFRPLRQILDNMNVVPCTGVTDRSLNLRRKSWWNNTRWSKPVLERGIFRRTPTPDCALRGD